MKKAVQGAREVRSQIRKTLNRIGAIADKRVELISSKTRDNPKLNVYKDTATGVIFIEDYYVGDAEYAGGEYRKQVDAIALSGKRNYEDIADSSRRLKSYLQFIAGKDICDFGCGAGAFLKLAQPFAKSVFGIELQQDYAAGLNAFGIPCFQSMPDVKNTLGLITLFHCLEHLPNPTSVLNMLRLALKENGDGVLVAEVPHARDFLIGNLHLQSFIDFTLWSQHLVLHTRDSLRLLLADAGFKNIVIEGVQRYSLSNHFHWLRENKPGGHKSALSVLETPELAAAYEKALAKIDATDTLVAVATT